MKTDFNQSLTTGIKYLHSSLEYEFPIFHREKSVKYSTNMSPRN